MHQSVRVTLLLLRPYSAHCLASLAVSLDPQVVQTLTPNNQGRTKETKTTKPPKSLKYLTLFTSNLARNYYVDFQNIIQRYRGILPTEKSPAECLFQSLAPHFSLEHLNGSNCQPSGRPPTFRKFMAVRKEHKFRDDV